jgi:uncharacterized protein (DUF2141 family)
MAGASAAADCEGTPGGSKLTIVAEQVRSDKGLVTSTLYNDPSKYLHKNGSVKVWRTPAQSPETTMCIWLPGPGTYAVVVYHDENSNKKWDHTLFFHPLEGGGFSNNPHLHLLPPPSYDTVKFQAGEGETTIHIKLQYPS